MKITIETFGHEWGPAPEGVKWTADVRDIPSSAINGLEPMTGQDEEVQDAVMATSQAQAWDRKIMYDVLPGLSDGDTIAVGCSYGQHRSVALAEVVADEIRGKGVEVDIEHRDLAKNGVEEDARDTADTIGVMKVTPIASARKWYDIKNAAADVAEVFIYDQIGEDWWTGEGVTAKQFANDINAVRAGEIHLHLNSPGGSVFDGVAIYNALVKHPAKVTTYIDGLAASIASVIALAGDRVVMAENALFMIHNPSGAVQGTADDMRRMADTLDRIREGSLLSTYMTRSTLSEAELIEAIDAETWYTAAEAQAAGFIDEVSTAVRVAASFDLDNYPFRHVPTFPADTATATAPAADITDSDEGGASSVGTSDGASEIAAPEAFIEGVGFHRFK